MVALLGGMYTHTNTQAYKRTHSHIHLYGTTSVHARGRRDRSQASIVHPHKFNGKFNSGSCKAVHGSREMKASHVLILHPKPKP